MRLRDTPATPTFHAVMESTVSSPAAQPAPSHQPQHGDLVVMAAVVADRWTISSHPGPSQLLLSSKQDAVHAAREYAVEAGVDVWLCAGNGYELIGSYRGTETAGVRRRAHA